MAHCMSLYDGDGCNNNDLADRKYVSDTIFPTKLEVRSFKREILLLAVSVTPTDWVPV